MDVRRTVVLALAASLALGMSSCSTTSGEFESSRQNSVPVGKRVADTALVGAAIPLKAVGWLIMQPFVYAGEAMSY